MAAEGKYEYWRTPESLLILKGYAREGMTDRDIANTIGVNRGTLARWKKDFPEIDAAIKDGRAPVKVKVEDAFYSRCEWRQVEDQTQEIITDPSGKIISKKIKVQKRWVPPDTIALIFALKNFFPERFNEHRFKDENVIDAEEGGGIVEIPAIIDIQPPEEETGE